MSGDVLPVIERSVRAFNEVFGLLTEDGIQLDDMMRHLKKCSEFAAIIQDSIGPPDGPICARLVALIQLQSHVINQLASRLQASVSWKPIEADIPTIAYSKNGASVAAVRTRLPHLPQDIIEKALEGTNYDANQATELLLLLSVTASTKISPNSKEMWQVQQVFPEVPEPTVASALSTAGNDPDGAINVLLVQGAAWAMSTPVRQLADTVARSRARTVPNVVGTAWGPAWMSELMPGLTTVEAEAALKASGGNVLQAFKLLKERQPTAARQSPSPDPHAPSALRESAARTQPRATTRRPSDDGGAPPPATTPRPATVPAPKPPPKEEAVIAQRLTQAQEAPCDFFKMNTRLMISTKRRVTEVIRSGHVPEREARIAVGQERLHDRLRCMGLKEVLMADDGNCQFRAFAHQLWGSADGHLQMRRGIVQYMRAHSELYNFYFDGEVEFQRYLAKMDRDKEWGDEMTLKAFSDCHRAVVHLVMSTGTRWYHKISPEDDRAPLRQVAITYLSPVHYNAIALDGPT